MKIALWLGMLLAVLMADGCVPERVAWSPDGTRAAIMGDDGVHFCDASGKLSRAFIPGVRGMQWTPDSKRIVVVRNLRLKTWKDLAAAFPREAAAAKDQTNAVSKEINSHVGTAEELQNIGRHLNLEDDQASFAIIYLRDNDPVAFKMIPTAVWQAIANTGIDACVAQVFDVADAAVKPGPALAYFLIPDTTFDVRISPTSQAVAITKGRLNDSENSDQSDVTIAAMDGSGVRIKLEHCSFPDWTLDGQQLIYVRQKGMLGDARVGELAFRNVVTDKGVVYTSKEFPGETTLGGMAYHAESRVRVARDGRIYFVGMEVLLPALTPALSKGQMLFEIDPKSPGKFFVASRKAEDSMAEAGDTLAFFEPSPDGKFITIPYQDGRVKVMEVATGIASFVQPTALAQPNTLGLATVPVWRTADELTFIRPREDGHGLEVVRYSIAQKKAVAISPAWPDTIKASWLNENK